MTETLKASSKSFCRNCEGDDPESQLPAIKEKAHDVIFGHIRKRVNELLEENRQGKDGNHKAYACLFSLVFTELCAPSSSNPMGEYQFNVTIERTFMDQQPWKIKGSVNPE